MLRSLRGNCSSSAFPSLHSPLFIHVHTLDNITLFLHLDHPSNGEDRSDARVTPLMQPSLTTRCDCTHISLPKCLFFDIRCTSIYTYVTDSKNPLIHSRRDENKERTSVGIKTMNPERISLLTPPLVLFKGFVRLFFYFCVAARCSHLSSKHIPLVCHSLLVPVGSRSLGPPAKLV